MALARPFRPPTVEPSPVVGVPGTRLRAPSPLTTPGVTLTDGSDPRMTRTIHIPANPATGEPAHDRILRNRQGELVGHAIARGTAVGLDAPTSLTELTSDHIETALDAAARQRKRAAGGAASSAPLLGGSAARPILSVRGLVGR